MPRKIREGFTTGSAVTAALVAALTVLHTGDCPAYLSIPVPPDEQSGEIAGYLNIPVDRAEKNMHGGEAEVIKDGGDDPDATNGLRFRALLQQEPFSSPPGEALRLDNDIFLYTGKGIGRASLKGLPVAVGEAAVNPAPRRQIAAALRAAASRLGITGPFYCFIEAPEGEVRAKHTLNPRLGIIGGISILGTRGTVKAYSSEAWQASIRTALDVARATASETVVFTTGRRSEKALQALLPEMPPCLFVQAADYAGFAMREAVARGFSTVLWACFPGKLLKQAQGLDWTHARSAPPDFSLLEQLALDCGFPAERVAEAIALPTVLGALEELAAFSEKQHGELLRHITRQAALALRNMAGRDLPPHNPATEKSGKTAAKHPLPLVRVYAFSMNGELLAEEST